MECIAAGGILPPPTELAGGRGVKRSHFLEKSIFDFLGQKSIKSRFISIIFLFKWQYYLYLGKRILS